VSTLRRTVEERLERHLHRREHQIRQLQSSRDYWMKRALLAEQQLSKKGKA
jgi:hypothetical protein